MFLCTSLLPSFRLRVRPSRASRDQNTAVLDAALSAGLGWPSEDGFFVLAECMPLDNEEYEDWQAELEKEMEDYHI